MDVLVEFCRSGHLGPLAKGADAAEVEQFLGKPRDIKWVQGDANWQRYKYGSLSLMLMSPRANERDHRLSMITVSFHRIPLDLPAAIDMGPTGQSSKLDDLLQHLRDAGVGITARRESSERGYLYQSYQTEGGVVITASDGDISTIESS